ncbi:hypothetical protein KASHIRA_02290 [Serratia phage vB_SmaM-Kashira]|nr:hypothetical protein KASHIRA_02290 [Serratia phage vB_SmaM-Kashira]
MKKTATELLMNALGWQGGTVHQVALATGLKVQTVLDLEGFKIEDVYQLEMYNTGKRWILDGGCEKTIPKGRKGYPLFWLGVLDGQKEK